MPNLDGISSSLRLGWTLQMGFELLLLSQRRHFQ
jgi:hypothetical protein